jgi:pimeloyl-ACP methyl ester carboxylesterase
MILLALIGIVAVLAIGAAVTVIGTWLIERAHPPTGRFIGVAGGRIHLLDLGEARAGELPVVLLHGASGNLEDMRLALGQRLSGRHRIILIDRPGHGWSDRLDGDADASPARQAARIVEALDRLGVGRAIIVGHSFGGTVAAALALDYPDRVAGLLLLAPVSHPWTTGIAWHYTLGTIPILGPLIAHTLALPFGMAVLSAGIIAVFAPNDPPKDYARESAVALVLRPVQFLANAHDVAGLLAFVTRQRARYGGLRMPTIIIAGDADQVVSIDLHARALAATLPDARLIALPGIGHMPHYAAPGTVVDAVEELAARLRTASKQ